MNTTNLSLLWFRQDLRIADNPALAGAIESGNPVLPIYLHAPQEEGEWAPGGAARWWLHHALTDLGQQLGELGLHLLIRDASTEGSLDTLRALIRETGATQVLWNRRYEPKIVRRDARIKRALRADGLRVASYNSGMLFEPSEIANKAGKPFQVFTPLWKHYQTLEVPRPVKVDTKALRAPYKRPKGLRVEQLELLPTVPWDTGFRETWGSPDRQAVEHRLKGFIKSAAETYLDQRDFPAIEGTSQLSPWLHFGQIGPREAWHAMAQAKNHSPRFHSGVMRQLVWREFAHHLLYHFPATPTRPLRPEFDLFPWENDENLVRRWQAGETGYPIVDAGMRQLWQTGWMHNRVRMIAGSLLVKHLLQHWSEGARWFWDTLVDADLANNTMGWQWIGGCGADAAPYFRVFNPIIQGQKFDPDGSYVSRYLPELKNLPSSHIHRPWELGELDLAGFGVQLGKDYPAPIIDHRAGRQRALDAFAELKRRRENR